MNFVSAPVFSYVLPKRTIRPEATRATLFGPDEVKQTAGRLILVAFVVLISPVAAGAQNQKRQPLETESSAIGLEPAIKQTVRRVLVDVVVSASQGTVTGLREEDFRVFENGSPQQIRSFSAPAEPSPGPLEINPFSLPPGTFTNASPVGDDAPLNIILWDLQNYESGFRNTQAEANLIPAMLYARRQVIQFLRRKSPGSRFAIIEQTDRLKLICGFTEDAEQLSSAMDREETRANGSWPTLHPAPSPFTTSLGDEGVLAQGRLMNRMLSGTSAGGRNRSLRDLENAWMMQGGVDGLWELARWLVVLPGRKNVYWLTSSFAGDAGVLLQNTSAVLALARIAVYPIDWRTLSTDVIYDVTTNPDYRTKVGGQTDPRMWLPQLSAQYLQDEKDRISNIQTVAEQTGGKAFFNTNDLKGALSAASEDGSRVYTLTYSPSNTKFNGERRNIKVEIPGKSEFHLSYRRSYFADPLKREPTRELLRAADPLAYASQYGAPTSQEILFTARVEKKGEPRPATQDETKQLAEFSAQMPGPGADREHPDALLVQNCVVHYSVVPSFVETGPTEKGRVAQLELAMTAYDPEGHVMSGVHGNLEQVVSEQNKNGGDPYRASQAISLPSRAAFLRLAVLDKVSRRIGSLQIPLNPH